jgi:hypothetical protein
MKLATQTNVQWNTLKRLNYATKLENKHYILLTENNPGQVVVTITH